MAEMGFKSFNEMIGQSQMLDKRWDRAMESKRYRFKQVLYKPLTDKGEKFITARIKIIT